MRSVYLALVIFVSVTASFAQAEPILPRSGIEEVYLAKDDGKGKAGEQVTEFKVTDVPIYCIVLLESNAKAVVKMNFVAVSVAGVKPDTKVVTASYTTTEGQNRVNFTGRPEGNWTAGKYRVDLFLNGKLVANLEFLIRGVAGPMDAKFVEPSAPTPPSVVRRIKP